MNWKNISKIVGRAAPALGPALGGPAGGVIGAMVASAVGVENDPAAIEEAIKKDPDAAIKLKQIELENEQKIREHLMELAKLKIEDRKSARQREVELAKTGKRNLIQPTLATIGVGAFFAMVGYLIAFGIADMSKEASFIVGNLTGIAGAIAKDIYGYYFGSSQGSSEKTEFLVKSSNGR